MGSTLELLNGNAPPGAGLLQGGPSIRGNEAFGINMRKQRVLVFGYNFYFYQHSSLLPTTLLAATAIMYVKQTPIVYTYLMYIPL